MILQADNADETKKTILAKLTLASILYFKSDMTVFISIEMSIKDRIYQVPQALTLFNRFKFALNF